MSVASLRFILSIKIQSIRFCLLQCLLYLQYRNDLAIYYSVKVELLFNLCSIAKMMAPCLEEIIEMPHVA